eukprot:COSAG04_NODE_6862_length_1239_cov_1.580702_1_plen_52_part_00
MGVGSGEGWAIDWPDAIHGLAGRWAWFGIGSAVALGVVLASLAAIGIMARR